MKRNNFIVSPSKGGLPTPIQKAAVPPKNPDQVFAASRSAIKHTSGSSS